MKKILKAGLIGLVGVFLLTGCRTAAVHNISEAPVMEKVTTDKVYKAVYAAGTTLGWNVKKVKPGLAVATLHLRKHMAMVEIPYTDKTYSIKYKDSANLNYNPQTKIIHSNYNGWIQNLNKGIQTQLRLQAM